MMKTSRIHRVGLVLLVLALNSACLCNPCSSTGTQRQQDNQPIVSGADLGNAVTARGIGDKNSPIGVTTTFNASEDIIYCIVEARRIDSGTSFFARWSFEGEPFEDTPVITADQNYQNTYIEFHIEPRDFGVLKAGDYSCKIYVNGNPVRTAEFKVQ